MPKIPGHPDLDFSNIYKSFGFEFLPSVDGELKIAKQQRYQIKKTQPGFNQVIFEVFPIYYLEGVITRERPQIFLFPSN